MDSAWSEAEARAAVSRYTRAPGVNEDLALRVYSSRLIGAAPGLVLHGGTAVGKRPDLVAAFQREDGPPFMVLSLKAGGTGLNLTRATHVVHYDRWWNPAVEDQASDRAWRIGQERPVTVHRLICEGTRLADGTYDLTCQET